MKLVLATFLFFMLAGLVLPPAAQATASSTYPSVTATQSTAGGAGTSQVIALPGGASVGDLLIACVAVNAATTFTWPTGWGAVFLPVPSASSIDLDCHYIYANATVGATVTVTLGTSAQAASVAYRIAGANISSAPLAASTGGTGSSTSPDPPSVTGIPTENRLYIAVFAWTGSATLSNYPANYNSNQLTKSQGTASAIAIASRDLNGGAENPGVATLSAPVAWSAQTITVRPVQLTVTTASYSIIFLELLAYVNFLALGLWFGVGRDNILWFSGGLISAGIIMVAVSFQAWVVTSSYFASISLVLVGILTIAYPVIVILRRTMS